MTIGKFDGIQVQNILKTIQSFSIFRTKLLILIVIERIYAMEIIIPLK